MAIEIVSFPIKNGGSFHSFLYVHQRVHHGVYFLVHWWLSSSRQKIRQGGFEGLIHAAWPSSDV